MFLFNNKPPEYLDNCAAIDDSGKVLYYKDIYEIYNILMHEMDRRLIANFCINCVDELAGYCAFFKCRFPQIMIDLSMKEDMIINIINTYNVKKCNR